MSRSVLSLDEKTYIMGKMLRSNPASGLSAADLRSRGIPTKIVPISTVNQNNSELKNVLGGYVERLIGGLSESEAEKIMSTVPYLQTTPNGLLLGNNVIDRSVMNSKLLKERSRKNRLGVNSNAQVPNYEGYEIQSDDFDEPEHYDDGYYVGRSLPKYDKLFPKKGGSVKKLSEWNLFCKKVGKCNAVKNLGSSKIKALSILYKMAKQNGIDSIMDIMEEECSTLSEFEKKLCF